MIINQKHKTAFYCLVSQLTCKEDKTETIKHMSSNK